MPFVFNARSKAKDWRQCSAALTAGVSGGV